MDKVHLLYWGPKFLFAKHDKHHPSRFGQTSLATALANFTITSYIDQFRAQYKSFDKSNRNDHKIMAEALK